MASYQEHIDAAARSIVASLQRQAARSPEAAARASLPPGASAERVAAEAAVIRAERLAAGRVESVRVAS